MSASPAPAQPGAAAAFPVRVAGWAAWSPGLEGAGAWRAWARRPRPLAAEGHPEARFLPAMLRRRCTPLTRTVLKAAFEACPDEVRPRARTVFASRHGSINESIGLLEQIARGEKLSPAKFSHTVHNAQAGLFSIATGNRAASSSLSACEDSFGCALLEAWTHLERDSASEVLLVMGDVPLAEDFAPLVDEPASAYAVALRLAADAAGGNAGAPPPRAEGAVGTRLALRVEPAPAEPALPAWPHAAELLRWLLEGAPGGRLALDTPYHRWVLETPPE